MSSQSLRDLVDKFHLYAICEDCQREQQLDICALMQKLGGDTRVHRLRSHLRCRSCGKRSEDMRIVYVGKAGQRAIFRYQR